VPAHGTQTVESLSAKSSDRTHLGLEFVASSGLSRVVESFVVESWAEHQRQHERVAQTDRGVEQAVRSSHHGERLKVSHMVYLRGSRAQIVAGACHEACR